MKKSVIVIVLVIYFASVFVVGIFGMKMKVYHETIYVDRIVCVNDEAIDDMMGDMPIKSIVIDFNEYYLESEGYAAYWLQWRLEPANPTNKQVSFSTGVTTVGSVDQQGIVKFNRKGTLTIYITSTDGKNAKAIVKVTAWKFND